MEAHGVVVLHKTADEAASLIQIKRDTGTDTVALESSVPALDFAVGLRVIG